MPRALSRDEQTILATLRRTADSVPIPVLADQFNLSIEEVQRACEYLISRGLLAATVYAVGLPTAATARHSLMTTR